MSRNGSPRKTAPGATSRGAAIAGLLALLALPAVAGCNSSARPTAGAGPAAVTPDVGPSSPPLVAGAPAATITLQDLRVGQTIELQVPKALGWSEPKSTDNGVIVATDVSDTGSWHLRLRAVSPGSAQLISQFDPCAATVDPSHCAAGRSARAVIYVDAKVTG
jgi:hypothetical protein